MNTMGIAEDEYRAEINSLAESIIEEFERYGAEDDEDIHEYIWETVDSHQWIIYNGYNHDVIKHNMEGLGEVSEFLAGTDDADKILQIMAFCGLREDVTVAVMDRVADTDLEVF